MAGLNWVQGGIIGKWAKAEPLNLAVHDDLQQ